MNFYKKALRLDQNKEYEMAIALYERSVQSNEFELNAYINLSFLYWQTASEFAFKDTYHISNKIFNISFDRYEEVLNMGIILFPNNAELHFWKVYFPHIILGEELYQDEVLEIVNTYDNTSLVPYFFLYLFNKEKYIKERKMLLKECSKLPIAKNLYIKSIIEDR